MVRINGTTITITRGDTLEVLVELLQSGGVPYVYDIEITMADGTVDTFIDRAKFIVTEEVD